MEESRKVTRIRSGDRIHHCWLDAAWQAAELLDGHNYDGIGSIDQAKSFTYCNDVFNTLAYNTSRDDFGVIAGGLVTIRSMSPLSFLVLASMTLNEGVNKLIQYQTFICDSLSLEYLNRKREAQLRIQLVDTKRSEEYRYLKDAILCWLVSLLREFGSLEKIVLGIALPQEPSSKYDYYADIFDIPVSFNQSYFGLKLNLSESCLFSSSNTGNHRLESTLNSMMDLSLESDFAERVQNLIISLFPKSPSQSQIAERLGISIRTLQRRLDDESTCYRDILESARKEAAHRYLKMNVTVFETAKNLGFRSSSNFSRAFKAWYGIAPSDYQKINHFHSY